MGCPETYNTIAIQDFFEDIKSMHAKIEVLEKLNAKTSHIDFCFSDTTKVLRSLRIKLIQMMSEINNSSLYK